MSGTMKIFYDRISDCLEMAVISCGSDRELKNGFHMPFIETAKYLGMNYTSNVQCWIENGVIPISVKNEIDKFVKSIL